MGSWWARSLEFGAWRAFFFAWALVGCELEGTGVPNDSHSARVYVPEPGNGTAARLRFEGPAVAYPAAVGETVTVHVAELGTLWTCPGEPGLTVAAPGMQLSPDCLEQGTPSYTQSSFQLGALPAGLSGEVAPVLTGPFCSLSLRAEHAGHFDVPITLTRDDGTSVEDSIELDFVEPKRIELVRDRNYGPGTSLPAFPGIAHAWCATAIGEVAGVDVPLLTSPESFTHSVSGVAAELEAFHQQALADWAPPAAYLTLKVPSESRVSGCTWLLPSEPGIGVFRAERLGLQAETEFELVDPESVTGFELRELPGFLPSAVGHDYVALDTPHFASDSAALGRIELTRSEATRRFAVLGRLADGTLSFGGRGLLTVGPHGVVDLLPDPLASARCSSLACWSFGFELNGAGEGELSAAAPNGDELRVAIDVLEPVGAP